LRILITTNEQPTGVNANTNTEISDTEDTIEDLNGNSPTVQVEYTDAEYGMVEQDNDDENGIQEAVIEHEATCCKKEFHREHEHSCRDEYIPNGNTRTRRNFRSQTTYTWLQPSDMSQNERISLVILDTIMGVTQEWQFTTFHPKRLPT